MLESPMYGSIPGNPSFVISLKSAQERAAEQKTSEEKMAVAEAVATFDDTAQTAGSPEPARSQALHQTPHVSPNDNDNDNDKPGASSSASLPNGLPPKASKPQNPNGPRTSSIEESTGAALDQQRTVSKVGMQILMLHL